MTDTCPSAGALEHFLRTVDDVEIHGNLAAHLDACASCRALAERMTEHAAWGDDLCWVNRLRGETVVDVNVPLARLNEMLSDYEIIEEIGRGGMGIVFAAQHLRLKRRVALKVLPALLGAVRPDAIGRFEREATVLARLQHTNIIPVFDFGQVDGTLYYTMPLIEGRSLREILSEIKETGATDMIVGTADSQFSVVSRGGADDPQNLSGLDRNNSSVQTGRQYYRRVAEWMAEVADALDYAHEHDVIHRDIKPSNLLLAADGRMMISDFGLARANDSATLTDNRSLLGTARYMSPEQVDEEAVGSLDWRSDVYGLGATMYEMLAMRPMFAGIDDREVLHCVLYKEPLPPRRFVSRVPRELETICLKAVNKNPAQRYAKAKDLAADLRRWLLGMPILARRPSLPSRAIKFARRRKLLLALVAILIFVLAGSGILYARYVNTHRDVDQLRDVVDAQSIELLLVELQLDADLGRFEVGLEKIDAALRIYPDHEDLQHGRATLLQFLGRLEEAVAYLEGVVTRTPHRWSAHYKLVELYSELGRADEACKHQRITEVLMPSGTAHWQVYYFQALSARDEEAVDLLSKATNLEPMAVGPFLLRCYCLRRLSRFEEMLQDAERAVAMRPCWAITYGQRGIALVSLKRYEQAIRDLDRAIELDPRRAAWWGNRAEAHSQLGCHPRAIADAEEALHRNPREAGAYAVRARSFAALGDLDGALADIGKALSINSNAVEIHLRHAWVLEQAGCYEEMFAVYDEAERLDPDNPKIDFGRAAVFYHTRRYDESIAAYTRVLEHDPAHQKARHYRAVLLTIEQQFEKAVADLTYVLDHEPTNLVARSRRGFAYEMLGAHELAMADYARLCEIDSAIAEYGALWRYLILRQTGQEQAAEDILLSRTKEADVQSWADRLFGLFTGNLNYEDLLEAAATDDECAEAYYYIGQKALLENRRDDAKNALNQCIELNRHNILETNFARARLKGLENGHGEGGNTAASAASLLP